MVLLSFFFGSGGVVCDALASSTSCLVGDGTGARGVCWVGVSIEQRSTNHAEARCRVNQGIFDGLRHCGEA